GAATMPLSGQLARKVMRRICDLQQPEHIDAAIQFTAGVLDQSPELAGAALDGLLEGQKGKALLPGKPASDYLAKFSGSANKAVATRAQQLGMLWGDPLALKSVLTTISDRTASDDERIKAIQAARQSRTDLTR